MKYHLNIRTITCPQPHCDKRFITTSHLYRHLQSHVSSFQIRKLSKYQFVTLFNKFINSFAARQKKNRIRVAYVAIGLDI